MHRVISLLRMSAKLWAGVAVAGGCFIGQANAQEYLPTQPDIYSAYTDRFYNPDTCPPGGTGDPSCMGQDCMGANCGMNAFPKESLWNMAPAYRVYIGADTMYMQRSHPGNQVLVRTSPDIFDFDAEQITPNQARGTTTGTPILPDVIRGGVAVPGSPNDPEIYTGPNIPGTPTTVTTVSEDPTQYVATFPLNDRGTLISNGIRVESDDFRWDQQWGFRPKIGVTLPSGNQVEFSYFWINDFQSDTIVDDVSGSYIWALRPTGTAGVAGNYVFQRMGYLNAPFYWPEVVSGTGIQLDQLTAFNGQVRNTDRASNTVFGYPTSQARIEGDIPLEPVNGDVGATGGDSLLWRDGEVAIIDYSSDVQGAELFYRRRIFEQKFANMRLNMLVGVRYLALDENLNFFFADIAGTNTPLGAGVRNGVTNPSPFQASGSQVRPETALADGQPVIPGTSQLYSYRQDPASTYATYGLGVDNDLIGPELGIECHIPVGWRFEFDLMSKGGFMANFMQNNVMVYRGVLNGNSYLPMAGYPYSKDSQLTSGVIEGLLGLSFYPVPNIRIKGGWEYMWLINVGTAMSNINYNGGNSPDYVPYEARIDLTQLRRPSNKDSVLLSGWTCGVEISY